MSLTRRVRAATTVRGTATLVVALLAAAPSSLSAQSTAPANAQTIDESAAYEIAVEAYHYLYPLVLMDITRRVTTNFGPGVRNGFGPVNRFSHMRSYPDADFRAVVRPNFDTLYSVAWLDLANGPMVVSAADTKGRYYLLPMLDMWSDVFAVPGKRTSGTGAGNWAVVPPGWTGGLPAGIERIDAPTPFVWIIGRTQTNGPKDYEAVHAVQDAYTVTPLANWGKQWQPPPFVADTSVDMKTDPLTQINSMSGEEFFAYATKLLLVNPLHTSDWSIGARLARLGIERGKSFAPTAAVRAAMHRAAIDGLELMRAKLPTLARVTNGWQMNTETMGVYGNAYLKRAIVAMVGLGANQPEDAIYPLLVSDSDDKPLTGDRCYVLHFEKNQLPPANAFWSVTMYDAEGFQVANPLSRFAIGDRDPLQYRADGSLDIYIQHASPGPDKESNWLPAPAKGQLGVTMRLYAPKATALDGRWNPPAVRSIAVQ